MASQSFTRMPPFTAIVQSAIAVGGLIASALGPVLFAGYVAAGVPVAVVIACRALPGLGRAVRPLLVLLAVSYPISAALWGETGLFWATAASIVASAASFVAEGLRPGALRSLSLAVLILLYYGFLASFLVLIRLSLGHRPLIALALIVFAYEAASAAVNAMNTSARPRRSGEPGALALMAGLLASVAASVVAGVFLNSPTTGPSLLLLGSAVGGAALLSHVTAIRMIDDPSLATNTVNGESSARLSALLLAAPAFLYGFRFLLT